MFDDCRMIFWQSLIASALGGKIEDLLKNRYALPDN